MHTFNYLQPKSVAEACSWLSENKGKANILAGGQSLVAMLKNRVITPDYIIDIKHIGELAYIRDGGESVKVGALTTHRTLETSDLVKQRLPVLVEAEHKLAHRQIRNWGTVGGDLCHADPAADISPPLIALDAKVKVTSTRGEREIPLKDFFVDYFTPALEDDEIMVEIEVPNMPSGSAAAYRKETITSGDYPIVSVAAFIRLDEHKEKIKEARIVLGAAGVTPIFAEETSEALGGKDANGDVGEEAGNIAMREANPVSDVLGSEEYKRKMVGILTREMVNLAIERARKI